MRIAIQTLGTRGDVQPYISLAIALTDAKHDVQLAAPIQFEAMVRERGISFIALPGEFLALLETDVGREAIASGRGFSAGFKLLKFVRPLMRRLMDTEWKAAKAFAPDAVVWHPKSLSGPHIAEALRCRSILASPLPGFTATTAFPSPLLPFKSLGPFNRSSHLFAIHSAKLLFRRALRDWRKSSLGLAPGSPSPPSATLYAYSRHVVPVPADWDKTVSVTGYWLLDSPGGDLPFELAAFIAAGDPPVYIGFGSMPGHDPGKLTSTVLDALRRTNKRGIIATGGGALAEVTNSADVFCIDSIAHDTLFPFVRSTIHHGGAGTTGASLRAGKPTAICPFFGDQPFWGRRIADLGVGPPPLDRKNLSVADLVSAIMAMEQPQMRRKANAIAELIGQEGGVKQAVRLIEAAVASST